ncbi:MAG: oligosaccharide flippase family protein [Nanoarchaeota archaeon]|nr:oligosaccharide flippase family protein [Nanoarchaeota archaeon]
MDYFNETQSTFKNIFQRFKKRDFSGNTGQAMKNSSFQLAQNLIIKISSFLFTIVVARLLMPELMGLYTLALSTIIMFSILSDFGIGSALFVFVAKLTSKGKDAEAKGYVKKLLKWKVYLLIFASVILLILSYFVSEIFYQKPIFYALLVGAIYLPILGFLEFLEIIFHAVGDFKRTLIKEILLQFFKLSFIPLAIFLLLKTTLSAKIIIALIFCVLIFCSLITLLIFWILAKKKISFLSVKAKNLNLKKVKGLKKFILPLTITILSGIFFGYIDTIMLGRFVESQFIAYYGVAFALVSSAISILSFASSPLFSTFSKLEGPVLEKMFKKSRNLIALISISAGILTYFLAYYIIKLAYGSAYLTAVPLLKWFSLLIIILPINGLYTTYFFVQKRTAIMAKIILLTTIINIVLNFLFINYGLRFGMFEAVLGVCFASIISRFVYFGCFVSFRKK